MCSITHRELDGIFQCMGNTIFESSGYDNENNVWKGESRNGTFVPTGTYFFTLTIGQGAQSTRKNGFVEVVQ